MNTTRIINLLFVIALSIFIAACSNKSRTERRVIAAAPSPTLQAIPVSTTAVQSKTRPLVASSTISAQDKLDVVVFKVPELSATDVIVESDGLISLPYIGSLNVMGLTIQQAEERIEALLRKDALQDPRVTVTRKEQTLKRVTVEGAVKIPGVFPIKGQMTFLQAIAMGQGLTELADTKTVMVFRDGKQYQVNLELVRKGVTPDPMIKEDDRIVVLKSDRKVKEKKVLEYLPAVLTPLSIFF